jgi:hypothetical protein
MMGRLMKHLPTPPMTLGKRLELLPIGGLLLGDAEIE